MTARKANHKPRVNITINHAKAKLTAAAAAQPGAVPKTGISDMQATILAALVQAGGGAMTLAALQAVAGANRSAMKRSFDDLKHRGLVLAEPDPTYPLRHLVTASASGRRMLWTHHTTQAQLAAGGRVPARTHIGTETYTPPASAYQRNTGHPHIGSRGVRC